MAKPPKTEIRNTDVITLALFAQRSPNAEFRERAFALALAAVERSAPNLAELGPLCEFAARTKAKNPSAARAREVALRLMRQAGHADLWGQLARSAKTTP